MSIADIAFIDAAFTRTPEARANYLAVTRAALEGRLALFAARLARHSEAEVAATIDPGFLLDILDLLYSLPAALREALPAEVQARIALFEAFLARYADHPNLALVGRVFREIQAIRAKYSGKLPDEYINTLALIRVDRARLVRDMRLVEETAVIVAAYALAFDPPERHPEAEARMRATIERANALRRAAGFPPSLAPEEGLARARRLAARLRALRAAVRARRLPTGVPLTPEQAAAILATLERLYEVALEIGRAIDAYLAAAEAYAATAAELEANGASLDPAARAALMEATLRARGAVIRERAALLRLLRRFYALVLELDFLLLRAYAEAGHDPDDPALLALLRELDPFNGMTTSELHRRRRRLRDLYIDLVAAMLRGVKNGELTWEEVVAIMDGLLARLADPEVSEEEALVGLLEEIVKDKKPIAEKALKIAVDFVEANPEFLRDGRAGLALIRVVLEYALDDPDAHKELVAFAAAHLPRALDAAVDEIRDLLNDVRILFHSKPSPFLSAEEQKALAKKKLKQVKEILDLMKEIAELAKKIKAKSKDPEVKALMDAMLADIQAAAKEIAKHLEELLKDKELAAAFPELKTLLKLAKEIVKMLEHHHHHH
uniref:DE NOVO PROTEIN P600 n=1 Tax=synthetic construct TaxID=32630 RepID=UPI003704D48D